MPKRALPKLTSERRQALEAELRVYAALEARATMDKYVHVSRCYDAGMTSEEITAAYTAGGLAVTRSTITRWRIWGEQERKRRREEGSDPAD